MPEEDDLPERLHREPLLSISLLSPRANLCGFQRCLPPGHPSKPTRSGLCLATALYVAVHSGSHTCTSRQGGSIRLSRLGTGPGMVASRVCYVNKEVRDVLTLHSPGVTPFTVVHTVCYFCPQFVLCSCPHAAHFWWCLHQGIGNTRMGCMDGTVTGKSNNRGELLNSKGHSESPAL